MKKVFVSLFLVMLALGIKAQINVESESQKRETNDLGIGFAGAYLVNENVWAPGIHLCYGKSLGEKQRFSLGLGTELIIGDHSHASVALSLGYSLTQSLSIGYGPGVEFHLDNMEENNAIFVQHIEIIYEFDLDIIKIGPMIEYGFNSEDQHLMVGIHAGIGF